MLFGLGRAALVDQGDWLLDQPLRQLARVGNGRAGGDKLGAAAVVGAEPSQAPQHVGDVAAKDAAINVQLVQHDVAQVGKKVRPVGVVGQDARVQHVGIGEEDARIFANRCAVGTRGVAVVGGEMEIGDWRLKRLRLSNLQSPISNLF